MILARRALVASLLALSFATTSLVAVDARAAEPSAADKETARSLVERGDKLYAAGDYTGALKVYKGAHTIMGVPTTGLRLARAQEKVGQLVEARDTYLQVARFPQKAGEPAAFTEARAKAQEEADALVARIPSVEVAVSGPPSDVPLTVRVDQETLPPDAATLPHKVNPGAHAITVTAPGFSEGHADVTVKEGQAARVPVSIAPAPGGNVAAASPTTAPTEASAPAVEHVDTTKRTVGFVVGGVGVAGIAVGTIFGLQALSKRSDRDANCNAAVTVCNQTGIDLDSDGRTAATISTIGFAAGLVGIGVGTYLVLTSKSVGQSGAITVTPAVGASGGGVRVGGAW